MTGASVNYSIGDAVILQSGSYMRELYDHEGTNFEPTSRQLMRSIVRLTNSDKIGIVTLVDGSFMHVSIGDATLIIPADSIKLDSVINVKKKKTRKEAK